LCGFFVRKKRGGSGKQLVAIQILVVLLGGEGPEYLT
jgi:hypothetical protein